jgi:hypothetical protein
MAAYKEIHLHVGDAEADTASMVGKTVNVYDTYAHALSHSSTGLIGIFSINRLTTRTTAVTQTAKTVGVTVDNNGVLSFAVDADSYSEVYLMSEAGRWGGPYRLVIVNSGTSLVDESSSSSSSASSNSSSSSTSSNSSSSSTNSSSSSSSSTEASATSSLSSSSSTAASVSSSSSSNSSSSSSTAAEDSTMSSSSSSP